WQNAALAGFQVIARIASDGRGSWLPHRRDKPVPCATYGLNVAGLLRIISQCYAKFLDDEVQPAVKVAIGLPRPKLFFDFFTGDKLARPLCQHHENSKCLRW